MIDLAHVEREFFLLADRFLESIKSDQHLIVALNGENSCFMRLNNARVRQIGTLDEYEVIFKLFDSKSSVVARAPYSTCAKNDEVLLRILKGLSVELTQTPKDPFLDIPRGGESTRVVHHGKLLDEDRISEVLEPLSGLDCTGIYCAGSMVRAVATSDRARHWFSDENYLFDFTLTGNAECMIKGSLGGREWDRTVFKNSIADASAQLRISEKPARELPPGEYRAFLGPRAVGDLVRVLGGAVGESAVRRSPSFLSAIRSDNLLLSKKFSLKEDFDLVGVPRFNALGELSPSTVTIFQEGKLVNTLVSRRTAKEYGLQSNGAGEAESMRAPVVLGGTLQDSEVFAALGTGIFLSDLHYLNWSDPLAGRVTGMTRFGALWVQDGEPVGPIKHMRFDDTFARIFGSELEDLTRKLSFEANVIAYENRVPGGMMAPGALLSSLRLTL